MFIPVIQQHLDLFRQGWAHHSLRTEHNRTPHQLWISGFQQYPLVSDDVVSGLTVSCILFKDNFESIVSTGVYGEST